MTPCVILYFFAFFSALVSATADCLPSEAHALQQLKQSVSDAGLLYNWGINSDCCDWLGVTCDTNRRHVTGLDLSALGLAFSVEFDFASLLNLTQLGYLNLAFNRFNSTVPHNLDGFQFLSHVNFSAAGFYGQIPVEISRIKTLVSLDLSVSSYIPRSDLVLKDPNLRTLVQDLSNLEQLYLDGVDLSSQRTEWCDAIGGSLPRLRILSLSNCLISGPFQPSLLNAENLTYLRLDRNNLSSPVPSFLYNFSSLTYLQLSTCNLLGDFPESIFSMQNLKTLDVSMNPTLRGRLPELPNNSSFQELVLSNTAFYGQLPDAIDKASFLTMLDLMAANFSGHLPLALSNLTRLGYLDLSSNSFSGSIPYLYKMSDIYFVDLSSNSFNGSFPDMGNGLSKLVRFNLRKNSITGPIPLSLFTLPSLQILQLGQNQFNGPLPNIDNWTDSKLTTIDLSYNELQGPIPMWLFGFSRLKVLTLSSNNFTGLVKLVWLENLRNLSTLDLSDNWFDVDASGKYSSSFPQLSTLKLGACNLSQIPEFLREQENLASLDLSNNRIIGKIPNWIWDIENLMYLNLSVNLLSGLQQPADKIPLSSLTVLDLHSNKIEGAIPLPPNSSLIVDFSGNRFISEIPSSIGSYLPYTIFFSLSDNRLIGEIPISLCIARFLQVLDLSGNILHGSIPQCLVSGISNILNVLNLRSNQISGVIPDRFPSGCNLKTVDLNRNLLQGQVPKSLMNCQNLEVLNMGNNMIEDHFPDWLGNMSSLRVLVLRSNRFFGQIDHQSAASFKALQIIDISSNRFSGILPENCFQSYEGMAGDSGDRITHFTDIIQSRILKLTPLYYQDRVMITSKGLNMELVKILTVFTSIDLSNNNFKGAIPNILGNLAVLQVLNLSRNNLTGPIPRSFVNLTRLESLDLSHNKISGQIPWQLKWLNFLAFLDLSHNYLEGRIPEGGQFNTFSESAFEGNLALCGHPLSEACLATEISDDSPSFLLSRSKNEEHFILAGVGFGAGVGVVMTPFFFWKKGRRWYNRHVDSMLHMILPDPYYYGKGSKEEKMVGQEFTGQSFEVEDGRSKGPFCVFCTELDRSGASLVHYECMCNL